MRCSRFAARSAKRSAARTRSNSYTERRYGSFERSITLPAAVEPEAVSAEHDKGVLTIRLPKASQERPKRITIRSQPAQ